MKNLQGTTLKNYEVKNLIGVGGFGGVYRAYQVAVDREVAIKVILPQYANEKNFIQKFEVEARLIARLEHPHIVPLYDFWREPDGAYIVMRYLRGGSLQSRVDHKGALDVEFAMKVLKQISLALATAHKNGVIHQDLKIANILLDEEQNAYLSDFGIAKDLLQSGNGGDQDDAEVLHGSPEYMAPEQLLRTGSDARSDIYSLGIVLFEMLTGKKPYYAPDDQQLIRKQLYTPVPSVKTYRDDLPENFDIVIQRATHKTPSDRYNSVLDMARNFQEFVDIYTGAGTIILKSDDGQAAKKSTLEMSIEQLMHDPKNPYKGLHAFEEGDKDNFFGREKLIETLYQRVRNVSRRPSDGSRFVAVVGASGSGKSSVVKAGLIPLLRNHNDWYVVMMTPGAHPLEALEVAVGSIVTQQGKNLAKDLRNGKQGLHNVIRSEYDVTHNELILFIDQFEEIYTLCQDESERNHLLDLLHHAVVSSDSCLRLVVTLRADYFDRPLDHPEFGQLMQARTQVVLPMNSNEIRDAIVKPAEQAKIEVEESLIRQIIQDVEGQSGVLPLMQFALYEMFKARKGTMTLTLKSYHDGGGMSGMLARRADELYKPLSKERKNIVREMFIRLINVGEGVDDTKRRIAVSELLSIQEQQDEMRQLVDLFSSRRLLLRDIDPMTRIPTVEIVHEALIRSWQQLREWIDASRNFIQLQRQLTIVSREWDKNGRDASYLASGARLAQYEILQSSDSTLRLNQVELDYLKASRRRDRRNARIKNGVIGLLGVLLILAMILSMFAFYQQQRALDAMASSRSREMSLQALSNFDQPDLASLLALEGLNFDDTLQAESALLTVLQQHKSGSSSLFTHLPGHSSFATVAEFSPDDQYIITAGEDQQVILWSTETYQPIKQITLENQARFNTAVFHPDEPIVVLGDDEGKLIIWNYEQETVNSIDAQSKAIWTLDFSADAFYLLFGGEDNSVTVWDWESLAPILEIPYAGTVSTAQFSPDGQSIALGGEAQTIEIWSLATGEQVLELIGHANWIRSLDYNTSGALLLSGASDGTVRLWSTRIGETVGNPYVLNTGEIKDVRFAFNDVAILAGSSSGVVSLIEIASGQLFDQFTMPARQSITRIGLDSTDNFAVVAGNMETPVIWNLRSFNRLASRLENVGQPVRSVDIVATASGYQVFSFTNDFSSDDDHKILSSYLLATDYSLLEQSSRIVDMGSQVLTASVFADQSNMLIVTETNGNVRFVPLDDAQDIPVQFEAGVLESGINGVFSVAVSPDAQQLALGTNEGEVYLFDFSDGAWHQTQQITGHIDRVLILAYSPDGSYLASGGIDTTVRIWDITNQTLASEYSAVHTGAVISLVFAPDNRFLASGGRDGIVAIYDLENQHIEQYNAHDNWVTSLQFNGNGDVLISGGHGGFLHLWKHQGGVLSSLAEPIIAYAGGVASLAVEPETMLTISGGEDGRLLLWQFGLEDWQHIACQFANRDLTEDEIQTYIGSESYVRTCTTEELAQ